MEFKVDRPCRNYDNEGNHVGTCDSDIVEVPEDKLAKMLSEVLYNTHIKTDNPTKEEVKKLIYDLIWNEYDGLLNQVCNDYKDYIESNI